MISQRRICSVDTPSGVWMLYVTHRATRLQAVVCEKSRPRRVLWHGRVPFQSARGRGPQARVAWRGNEIVVRLDRRTRRVAVTLSLGIDTARERPEPAPAKPAPARLERNVTNPILEPVADHPWESLAVMNPAAIALGGSVHLVYRAIGSDGLSVFGYAASRDGLHIDERLDEPIYTHDRAIEAAAAGADVHAAPGPSDRRSPYQSGISRFGCEDPRITRIGERIYMTYTSFDGSSPPSVALTSIGVDEFLQRRWNWTDPVRLSAPHQAHKNWVLFPEMFGGRYALLHGISPDIQIEFLDRLDFDGDIVIDSRYSCSGRRDCWDNRLRGAGPPPVRTDDGWLLLYHAMDCNDPDRYKIGAALLALDDPRRVLARLPHPLLAPDARCENDGFKCGVVYACGAARIGEMLRVYYGGADTVVCAASVALDRVLAQLRPETPGDRRKPAVPARRARDRVHAGA